MASSHENRRRNLTSTSLSRRDFLKTTLLVASPYTLFAFPVCGLLSDPLTDARATPSVQQTLLDEYLGERLNYTIGFWLLSHCGEANVRFCKSPSKGIYVARMSGRTAGFVDWLVGRYRYSYVSYAGYDKDADRLFPLFFKLVKRRKGKEDTRTVTFNYQDRELIFARRSAHGKESHKIVSMKEDALYEDYLTLFYNFRHGYYGPILRGMTYHLPLHIHEGFDFLDLTVGSIEEQQAALAQELNPEGKDYFVRFRVLKEDVSSKSGKIIGWLSKDGIPTKGVIKDVIFFGDLWGVLVKRQLGQKFCETP